MTKHTHNFVTVKAGTHDTSYPWLTSLLRKLRLVNKLCTYVVSWLLTKFERRPPDQRNNTVRMLNEDVKKNWNLQVENLQHWFFIKVKGFFLLGTGTSKEHPECIITFPNLCNPAVVLYPEEFLSYSHPVNLFAFRISVLCGYWKEFPLKSTKLCSKSHISRMSDFFCCYIDLEAQKILVLHQKLTGKQSLLDSFESITFQLNWWPKQNVTYSHMSTVFVYFYATK